MRPYSIRRFVVDMIPMVDMLIIMLFGMIIYTTHLNKRYGNRDLVKQLQERISSLEQAREKDAERLKQQRLDFAMTVAQLLQMSDKDLQTFQKNVDNVANANGDPQVLANAIQKMKSEQGSDKLLKAMRRLEELQRTATFIDVHLDSKNNLHLIADRQPFGFLEATGKTQVQLGQLMSELLAKEKINDLVLVMFSNEDLSPILTAERIDLALEELLRGLRDRPDNKSKVFRYGKVGIVMQAPDGVEKNKSKPNAQNTNNE